MPGRLDGARILVVDDTEEDRRRLGGILAAAGSRIVEARDGGEALRLLHAEAPDLVVLDLILPDLDGIDLCRRIRTRYGSLDLPVVIVTRLGDTSSRVHCKAAGADEFLSRPVDETELLVRTGNLLELKRLHARVVRQNDALELAVRSRTRELSDARRLLSLAEAEVRRSWEETIRRLAAAAEFRDNETGLHLNRMSLYAELIARRLGLGADRAEEIRIASPMHDVGKIGVPDEVLRKPGPLEPAEYEVMKRHTTIGHRILSGSGSRLLDVAAMIAWTHHERYDGTGYPRGLAGAEIPIEGRIVAVADVFDALTSARVYKPAFPVEESVDLMRRASGSHFDPVVVDAFFSDLDEVLEIRERYRDP